MKLHLPVKLRASVIAAILAVPAMLYNAFAADIVAPSQAFGWDNNDIEFVDKEMATAGNTYTANSTDLFECYPDSDKAVGVAVVQKTDSTGAPVFEVDGGGEFVLDADGNKIPVMEVKSLDYDMSTGKYSYKDGAGQVIPCTPSTNGLAYDTAKDKYYYEDGGVTVWVSPEGMKLAPGTDPSKAQIIIKNKNYGQVSYITGDTTMVSQEMVIHNSVASANKAEQGISQEYKGDLNIVTDKLDLEGENIRVVFEDATLQVKDTTELSDKSRLVILNGTTDVDQFTAEEKGKLGIAADTQAGTAEVPTFVDSDVADVNGNAAISLGKVIGGGSVTVVGRGDDTMTVKADSVNIQGSLDLGDVKAVVVGGIGQVGDGTTSPITGFKKGASSVKLINSEAEVGGDVTFNGLYVDAESILDAEGHITNAAGGGSGYIDVAGIVEADKNIYFDNGKKIEQLGIKDGAVVAAGGDFTLRNVDADKASQLTAGGDITLVEASTIVGLKGVENREDKISAGGSLIVGDGSSISDAVIESVGGDVLITEEAAGHAIGGIIARPSSISNTDITVNPAVAGASDITVEGGSSMTDSTITGADGNVTIKEGSTVSGSIITNNSDTTDGAAHSVVIDASTVTGSAITGVDGSASITASTVTDSTIGLTPDASAPATVTVNNSTATNTHIVGGNGDITVSNSTITVEGKPAVMGTDADGNPIEITPAYKPTTNFIGDNKEGKEGLGKILSAAGKDAASTTESMLTSESLEGKGFVVGSSIENTSGAVNVTDSKVNGTLITGGGSVTIDDTDPITDAEAQARIDAVKDLINSAIAEAQASGEPVVVPYMEIDGKFGTVVDGSIIDVRGNLTGDPLPVNDLTVTQAALTNSVVLGVTGKITVKDSVLGNDYIDGGSGMDIDNSVIVDTDIVNLTADIVLQGNSAFISTDPAKRFVINTLGNYGDKDQDEYTGGSIILMDVDLTNGTIKSGVEAKPEVDADGNITGWKFVPVTSDALAQQWDGSTLVPVDGTTKLPYGQVLVQGSTLTNVDIATAAGDITIEKKSSLDNIAIISGGAGNISISDSKIKDSDLSTQQLIASGKGSIEVTNSKVYDTNIVTKGNPADYAAGEGAITITKSTITDTNLEANDQQVISTGGAGSVTISDSNISHTNVNGGGEGDITIGGSKLDNASVGTNGAGNITITESTIIDRVPTTQQTITTGGKGNIGITDSTVYDTDVYTKGEGSISIAHSVIADKEPAKDKEQFIQTNGAGNISITDGSEISDTRVVTQGDGNILIDNSTIKDTEFATEQKITAAGAGNITISNGAKIYDTHVVTGKAGNITITDSVVETSRRPAKRAAATLQDGTVRMNVTTGGDGKIDIARSTVTRMNVSNNGVGDLVVTDSTVTDSVISTVKEGNISLKATAATSTQPTDAAWVSSNNVTDSTISTGKGNIGISATKVQDSVVKNLGDGNITISNSAILGSETTDGSFTTQVSTKGKGDIKVTDSITDKASVTTGAGNISLVGTLPVSEISYSSTAPYTSNPSAVKDTTRSSVKFTNGLEGIGVPRDAVSVSKVSIELKNLGSHATGDKTVTFELKKDGVTLGTATVTLTEELRKNGGILTIDFGQDIAVNPTDKDYSLVFSETIAMKTVELTDGSKPADAGTGIQNAIVTMDYKAPIRDLDDAPAGSILSNVVADSLIQSEGDGNITITRTDMDRSKVLTGKGNTTITASDIKDSLVESTEAGSITIKGSKVETSDVLSGEGADTAVITIADSDILQSNVKALGVDSSTTKNTITNSYVENSVVYAADDDIVITSSEVLGSDVETANGGMFVRGESTIDSLGADTNYDKSTLTATDDSKVFEGSYVSGTNISITDTDNDGVAPDLTVEGTTADGTTPTTIAGDVNMIVGGMVDISTDGKLALDGNRAQNPVERDASITATTLRLKDIWNAEASIANAQVEIDHKTTLRDGNTLTLDSVNSVETEGVGTLGDLLQTGDAAGTTTVAIKGASNLQTNTIGYADNDNEDSKSIVASYYALNSTAEEKYYFDRITVDEDSKLTAKGTVMIDTLDVNKAYNDLAAEGSHVTMEKDAHIINANLAGQGVRGYTGLSTPDEESFNIGATIYGDAHIGNLNLNDEAVLNLVKKESSIADPAGKHYIANVNTADIKGTINLIGGELTTPELLAEGLDLGLNGGTVILEPVTDAKLGATKTSAAAANATVVLRSVTNASMAGGIDKTPCGPSTIKTTVDRVVSVDSIIPGTETKTTATTYYYKVMSDTLATADTTVQRWNGTALETVTVANGDTLKSGDIISKTDKVYTTTTASDGSVVNTGIATSNAHELSSAEESYLVRITVPVLDENGEPTFTEIAAGDFVLNVGQTVTQEELTYFDGYAEIDGSVVEMTDGIASLTVKEGFDADNTTIKAYETGSYKYMLEGVELTQAQYDALTDDEKAKVHMQVVVDGDTGFIAIDGALTGQDNTFYADNDITIKGGIMADGGADVDNNNTLTSARGTITANGITGSSNDITATEGDIVIGSVAADGTITPADIEGDENVLTAGGSIVADDITGSTNDLIADENIIVNNITGNDNILDAGEALITGTITGDTNELAGKTIETESIAGDNNIAMSDESTKVDGTLAGDDNTIVAGTTVEITGGIVADAASSDNNFIQANDGDITIGATDGKSLVGSDNVLHAAEGDVKLTGDLVGSSNTINALEDAEGNGGNISMGNVEGNENVLTADESIKTDDILGDKNDLAAGTTIVTGNIGDATTSSNNNVLDAGTSIETENIKGDENQLTAGTSITTEDISGNKNVLDAGTSITTADINGNENHLTAGSTIDTNDVTGASNTLEADGMITIDGNLTGEGNVISSYEDQVYITGDVTGKNMVDPAAVAGNSITASDIVTIDGNLGGQGTNVTVYANGLSQDDVAIFVGSFNAQDTDLSIATTTSPEFGTASGNGSIVIGEMTAVDGEVDSKLMNNIVSNNSFVQVGALNGANAYTTITAAKDVIIGTDHALLASGAGQSASNLSVKGKNFVMQTSVNSLTLTDSTINVTESITGSSLTLTTTLTGMDQPAFASTAATVVLGSLELANNAMLTAGSVTVKDLTIDGAYATLNSTNLTATGTLTLQNGAVFDLNRVQVKSLVVEDSTLNTATLTGINNLTLTHSVGIISSGVTGMTGDVIVQANANGGSSLQTSVMDIGGKLEVTGASNAVVTGNISATKGIAADGESSISGLNITTQGALSAKGESSISGQNITAGAITAEGDSTITATGKITGTSLTVNDSKVTAAKSINLTGALNVTDGTVEGSVKGATNATITGSTGTATTGDIEMTGRLVATNATIGDVSGATGATLDKVQSGDITMGATGRDITMTNGSTVGGNIANANDVTIDTSKVTGTVAMDGKLKADSANLQGGLTEGTVLTSADITGSTIGSGITSTGDVAIDGASTIKGAVSGTTATIDNSTIDGAVTATTGNATITGASTIDGAVTAKQGTASVTGGSTETIEANAVVTDTVQVTGNVISSTTAKLTNGTVSGKVQATGAATIAGTNITGTVKGSSVSMNKGMAASVEATSTDVQLTDATIAGTVTAQGNVTMTGGTATNVTATTGNATITGADSVANVTATSGLATIETSKAATVNANSVKLTDATITGSDSVVNDVNATTSVVITGASSIAGNVNAGTSVGMTGGSVAGNVNAGTQATLSAATITGTVTARDSVTMTGGEAKQVKATAGDVTLTNATIKGDADASTVDVSATGLATITGGSIAGDVQAAQAVITGTSTVGDVTATGANADLVVGANGETVTAAVYVSGVDSAASITAQNGGAIVTGSNTGAITAEDSVQVTNGQVTGNITVNDKDNNATSVATLEGATIIGNVTAEQVSLSNGSAKQVKATAGDATITNATVDSVDASGIASVSGTKVNGTTDTTVTDDVKGNSVVLKDASVGGDVKATTSAVISGTGIAGNVNAGSLSLTGGSEVGGTATITGAATIKESDVKGLLTVNGGALTASDATIGGIAGTATSAGLTHVTVAKDGQNADVTIAGALTMDTVTAANVTAGSVTASNATISGKVEAKTGEVDLTNGSVGGDVTATTTVTTEGTTITGKVSGTAVTMTGGEAKQVQATAGNVTLTNATIKGDADTSTADVSATGLATINGGSVAGDVKGAQVVVIGTTENGTTTSVEDIIATGDDASIELASGQSVTAAVIATNTKVNGSITAEQGGIYADAVIITGNVNAAKAVTAMNGSITGAITSATDVTLTNNDVKGADGITMTGALSMTNSDAAKVTGATSATLTDADITGDLAMKAGSNGTVTAEGGSIGGAITNAGAVSLEGTDVTGSIGMNGALTMTEGASAAKVTGATSAELDDATISGELNVVGGIIEATDATIGSITGTASSATLTDVTVGKDGAAGSIAVTGSVEMIGSTAGTITGATSVTLTGNEASETKVGEVSMNGKLTMTEASAASVTGATSAELDKATITGELNVTDGSIVATDATIGSITGTASSATLEGVTVAGANGAAGSIAVTGSVEMIGSTAGTITGATSVTLSDKVVDAADGSQVVTDTKVDGSITMSDALTMDGAEVTGTITGATSAELTDATISGDLAMTNNAEANDVTAIGGSIGGNITGADAVSMEGTDVTGSIGMNGALTMTEDASAAKVTGATSAELDKATITGELNVVGGIIEATDATIGSITGTASSATLEGVTVAGANGAAGSIAVTGSVEMIGSTAGTITGATSVTLSDKVVDAADGSQVVTDTKVDGSITMSDALVMNGAEVTGTITGATSAELTDATISGDLAMTNNAEDNDVTAIGGSIGGNITGADAVSLEGTDVTGSIGMSGKLNMTKDASAASVTGATSAELNDATITGALTMTGADADVKAENGSSIGSISGANDVTLTKSDVTGTDGISMSGALSMTEANAAKVTGATSATLDKATISGELNVTGDIIEASSSTIGSITGTASSATLEDTTVNGGIALEGDLEMTNSSAAVITDAAGVKLDGSSIGTTDDQGVFNAGSITMDGVLEMSNGAIAGDITGATDATIDGADTKAGNIAMNGDLTVTNGAQTGAITGTVNNATLSNGATIGSGLTVGGLTAVEGDVTVKGNISTEELSVTDGKLTAKAGETLYDVTVSDKTTLDNGSIIAGKFSTQELELKNMDGTVNQLVVENDLNMAGTHLIVTGAGLNGTDSVTVGKDMILSSVSTDKGDQASMLVKDGNVKVDGSITVSGGSELIVEKGSVTGKGGVTVSGADSIIDAENGVTSEGAVSVTDGAKIDGAVLGSASVAVTRGTITGAVTTTGAATLTAGSTGAITMNGTTGALSMTDNSTAASVTGADGAKVDHSTVTGELNVTSGKLVASSATIGSITGAAESAELTGTHVGTKAADGTIATYGNVTLNGALTMTEGSSVKNVTAGSVSADDSTIKGNVTATGSVILDDTDVEGTDGITMNGALSMTNSDAAKVTGATSAMLKDADITGDLTMKVGSNGTVTAEDSTIGGAITNAGAVSLDGTKVTGSIGMNGALTMTEASAAEVTGATSATLTDASITGDLTMTNNAEANDVTAIVGSIGGDITGADAVSLDGTDVTGSIGMNGALTMTEGASAASVTGATSAELDDATITGALTMTGADADVKAENGSSIGSISGANDVTLTKSDVTGTDGISMNGALSMTEANAAKVTGATSAELDKATISGALTMTGADADVKAENGSSIGSISGANDVTLTKSDVTGTDGISMNGALSMTEANAAKVTGASSAELDKATISGELNVVGGIIEASSSNIGSITGSATSATLTDVTVADANGDAGSIAVNGSVEMIGSTAGTITGATSVTLTGNEASETKVGEVSMNGKLTMTEASATKVTGATSAELDKATITGDLTMAATGTDRIVSVTDGAITGTISNADKVTLKDATAGAITGKIDVVLENSKTTDSVAMVNSGLDVKSLDVTGNVTVKGDIASETLKVTNGTLTAKDDQGLCDVTVSGKTTLANGTVEAAVFESGEIELIDMGGSVEKLISGDTVTMNGTHLTVTSDAADSVDVAKNLVLTSDIDGDIATLNTKGGVDVEGTITVNGGSKLIAAGKVDGKGGVTVSGTGSIIDAENGVTSEGAVSVTDGAEIDGAVLGSASVEVNDGAITGDVTSSGAVSVTDGTITGAVLGSASVEVNAGSITGNVTSSGAVSVTDGSIGGAVTGTDVTVNGADSTVGAVTMNGTLTVDGGTTGAITGTVNNATLSNDATIGSGLTVGGTTAVTNGAEVKGDLTTGDLTIADGTLKVTGKVTDKSTDGLSLSNAALEATGSVELAGGLTVENGASLAATGTTIDGALKVQGADSSVTGAVTGATTADISKDGVLNGDLTATDKVTVSEAGAIKGNVLGSGSVELTKGAAITGNVTTTGAVSVDKSNIGGDVTGATTVDVTGMGSITGSVIDATDKVTVTDGSIGGSVTTTGDVEVTSGSIAGAVNADGIVTATNGTIGSITGATDVTVQGNNASVGDVTMNGDLNVLEGAQTGKITGTVNNATLTDNAIIGMGGGTLTVVGTMTTTGDVTVQGAVKAGTLTVNHGTLHAKDADGSTLYNVDVTGKATLNGGAVAANKFTAEGGVENVGTDVTIGELVSGSDVVLDGGDTNVSGDAIIGGNLDMSGGAELDVLEDVNAKKVTVTEGSQFVANSLDLTEKKSRMMFKATRAVEYGVVVEGSDATSGVLSTVDIKNGINAAGKGLSVTNGGVLKTGKGITNAGMVVVDTNGSMQSDVKGATTVDVTNGGTLAGNVEASAEVTVNAGTIAGNVTTNSTVAVTNGTITGAVEADGSVTATNGTIGSIAAATDVTVKGENASVGTVTMNGKLSVLDGAETGKITSDSTVTSAELTNGAIVRMEGETLVITGALATTGDVRVEGGVEADSLSVKGGDLTASNGLTGAAQELYDVNIKGETTLVDGEVIAKSFTTGTMNLAGMNGHVGSLDVTGDTILNNSDMTVDNGMNTGTLIIDGKQLNVGGEIVANDEDVVTEVKNGATMTGDSMTLKGGLSVEGATENGTGSKVVANGNIDLNGKGLTASDDADVQAGTITNAGAVDLNGGSTVDADVTGATTVDVTTGGTLAGNVEAADDVTVNNGTITGDVTTTGDLAVTANGKIGGDAKAADVELSKATIGGELTATGATTVKKDSEVGSADLKDLTVKSGAELTAEDGDLVANGVLDIDGELVADKGDIILTGAKGSSIDADVTATTGDVTLAGEMAAKEVTFTGKEVAINGTLNAAEGVELNGIVIGSGQINKTGGDTLVLDELTNITGGVDVSDASTLDAAGSIGKLTMSGASTLKIAGDEIGKLTVNGGKLAADTTVEVDLNLTPTGRAGIYSDEIAGKLDLGNAKLVLNDKGTDETMVKEQHRETIAANATGSFHADVVHGYETLNVHAEGGEIVFSKNYKGAQNKTENQAAVADGLASLPANVTGELADVMDALAHTRSEADALAALDSLGGAGLAAAPKLVSDETKEHLQTLRSTLQSVAAGLERRWVDGVRREDIESTAISGSVTGGTSTVDSDDNAAEYTRSSLGAMLTVAHAINKEWTFGGALSFSQSEAECGATTVDASGIFLDVGVIQKRGRFTQMGTIGCAFFDMDTERDVMVNAPGHAFSGTAEGTTSAAAVTVTYETSYAIWQTEEYSVSSVIMGEALFAQIDNMEEEGMGNAGLRTTCDDIASFTFGVGGRYTYHFGDVKNPGYLALEAMFVADAGDGVTKVNNTFIGGGDSFELSSPEAGNCGLRLNAGLLVPFGDSWAVFGNATGEIRSGQTNVGGSVGVKCSF